MTIDAHPGKRLMASSAALFRKTGATLLILWPIFGGTGSAVAQGSSGPPIPLANFATTHFWGSPQAIDTKYVALGNAYAADGRSFSIGQPASLTALHKHQLLYQYSKSDFDDLPTFVSSYTAFITPLDKRGDTMFEAAIATVDATGRVKGGPSVLNLHTNETDVGVVIGHRFSRRLQVGVATGYLGTRSRYSLPNGVEIERLKSVPKFTLGGRVGAIYELTPKLSLGATYDNYTEQVTADVMGVGSGHGEDFHSVAYRVGLAWRPDARTTILLDREELGLHGDNTSLSRRATCTGIERRVGSAALRVGLFEGRLTGGVGVRWRKVSLSYAFTNRYSAGLPGTGAKTNHNVELTVGF